MDDIIINRVAQSGLETIDLEKYYPGEEIRVFDLKDFLFMGMILKEKEYRDQLKNLDWSAYAGKNVCITCTADAIIPHWAYMLAITYLQPVAKEVVPGNEDFLRSILFLRNLSKINIKEFEGKRVIIKGCGDKEIPPLAYAEITRLLVPVAKSILYGEPCSTVPVYKRRDV